MSNGEQLSEFDSGRERNFGGMRRRAFKRKFCKVCEKRVRASYREPEVLRRFITERGKILPRRITGICAKHQRLLAREIKRCRTLALLPFDTQ